MFQYYWLVVNEEFNVGFVICLNDKIVHLYGSSVLGIIVLLSNEVDWPSQGETVFPR